MATTTVSPIIATTVGTLKLNGSTTPKRKQPDADSLAHACVVADDLITRLNQLNDSLMTALDRLRNENTHLHNREKCLGVEVQAATKLMRRWRMFCLLTFLFILLAAITPYAIAFAVDNGVDELLREATQPIRRQVDELMAMAGVTALWT